MALKKEKRTPFYKECATCPSRNLCTSAGAFGRPKRSYFLHLKGYEIPANKFMIAGTENHDKAQIGLKEIDEYGIDKFFSELKAGRKVSLKELPVCSGLFGLKGVVDKISFRYFVKTKQLNIIVTEFKSSFNKKHIFQLASYGLIFTDKNMLVGIGEKGNRKVMRFFDKLEVNSVYISFKLTIFNGGDYEQDFMVGNVLTKFGSDIANRILRKKADFKDFHRSGLYLLERMKECPGCSKNEDKCAYWKICKKLRYKS